MTAAMRRLAVHALVASLAACSGRPEPSPIRSKDGGVNAVTADPATMRVDDGDSLRAPNPQQPSRGSRPIDITLRSTPPNAEVSVDGLPLGNTPAYWGNGVADGRDHEFVFVLPRHAVARYRFVPITSG